ncbi:MAG: hypothetical protein V1911_01500 [Candidatus Micrarchaeota archaeon]
MEIAIIESGNAKLADLFEKRLFEQSQGPVCKKQKARDVFDALAYAKKAVDKDYIVLIVELNREDKEEAEAFMTGLANLEASTGKEIFKLIYRDGDNPEALIEDLVVEFIKKAFDVEVEKEEKKEDESEEFPQPPEMPEM